MTIASSFVYCGAVGECADVPTHTRDLLYQAEGSLLNGLSLSLPGQRYTAAYLGALRAAAAVLSIRGRPAQWGRPWGVWQVIPLVAPELTEWALFFTDAARRGVLTENGSDDAVTHRQADDLLRGSDEFLRVVEVVLGVPEHPPLPPCAVVLR
ncbi:MAG: SAV_6107 family HEPN domain-containing protein [Actinomycetota bacterium]